MFKSLHFERIYTGNMLKSSQIIYDRNNMYDIVLSNIYDIYIYILLVVKVVIPEDENCMFSKYRY